MKFLVDAQLPPALAHWLRGAGHEAQAVGEVGLRDASDTVSGGTLARQRPSSSRRTRTLPGGCSRGVAAR